MKKINNEGLIIEIVGNMINYNNKLYYIKLDVIGNKYFIMDEIKYYLAYFKAIKSK